MSDHHESELPTEARLALQSGRKIEAIRILREQTGMSLTQAKAVVDRAAGNDGRTLPQRRAGREDSGTLRLIAALLVLGGIAAAYFFL